MVGYLVPKTLFIAGKKGSSAKTTLSLSIARLVLDNWEGTKVAIRDLDHRQNSSTQFSKYLKLPLVPEDQADFIIVDSGGGLENMDTEYARADKIVLCCCPSPMDITVQQAYAKKELLSHVDKTKILWTRVKTIAGMDKKIVAGEGDYQNLFPDFKKMKNFMRETVAYKQFIMDGNLSGNIRNEIGMIMLEIQI